jgi:hypothetical protein
LEGVKFVISYIVCEDIVRSLVNHVASRIDKIDLGLYQSEKENNVGAPPP